MQIDPMEVFEMAEEMSFQLRKLKNRIKYLVLSGKKFPMGLEAKREKLTRDLEVVAKWLRSRGILE